VTAIVTGASRGIGRATALELARRQQPLALLGRPSEGLEHTAAQAKHAGVRVEIVPCDVRRPDHVKEAAAHVLKAFGPPLAVVNNAAVIHRAPVEDLSDANWDEQLEVNLRGPFLLTRALLPAMRAAERGNIVHVSSISGTLGTGAASAYCASKWGLIGFMKSLAEESSGSGLMTVAILPGSVETKMLEGSGFSPKMTADDVAKTIVHYALDASVAHNGGVVEMFGT
jgi:3-oxoacyl-[acyl-carrier protein] reductase